MSFLSRVLQQVPAHIRLRGEHYARAGRVRYAVGTDDSARAVVIGSRPYDVTLERVGCSLKVACTCPYMESSGSPCKHIWAAAVVAGEEGLLRADGPIFQLIWDGMDDLEETADEEPDAQEGSPEPGRLPAGLPRLRLVGPVEGEAMKATPAGPPRKRPGPPPLWKRMTSPPERRRPRDLPPRIVVKEDEQILYYLEPRGSDEAGTLLVSLWRRRPSRNGRLPIPRPLRMSGDEVDDLPDDEDRRILGLLQGGRPAFGEDSLYVPRSGHSATHLWSVSPWIRDAIVPLLCRSGRFSLKPGSPERDEPPLRWDERGAWRLTLDLGRRPEGGYALGGSLARGDERLPLNDPSLIVAGGLVFFQDEVAPLDDGHASHWIPTLRRHPQIPVKDDEIEELLGVLVSRDGPPLGLPEELRLDTVRPAPRPRLSLTAPEQVGRRPVIVNARLTFSYEGKVADDDDRSARIPDVPSRRVIARDMAAEQAARDRLLSLFFRRSRWAEMSIEGGWRIAASRVPEAVRALVGEGWHVEAEGALYRPATAWRGGIISGMDWLELRGEVTFGDESVPLPDLLKALQRGTKFIRLGDGTVGMLPEEWMTLYGLLADLGRMDDGVLKFRPSQAFLLDALLRSHPGTTFDEGFDRARERLRRFEAPRPLDPARSFAGTLRPYQKEGLGWMLFLRRVGFGGCLADDMGLGKTVQVLALLDARRRGRGGRLPSLVIAPRSLIFNWKEEAARFTPAMRLRDHTGLERMKDPAGFESGDVVLTTYGTLRRDISWLKDVRFDTVVLDEAQAIKNAASQSAKAARLLQASHRLALSGTPVENHLGELWSLFEFLNPGLLGASSLLRRLTSADGSDSVTADLIARAVRPYILRRTKAQVAPELPPRVEQTLSCILEGEQRARYEELKRYFQRTLAPKVEEQGMARTKFLVLEALLRLRQAACHLALIDPSSSGAPSAKLDVLLLRLEEVLEEGHKALIFSQFTSFLALLKPRLDERGIRYAYLDGATRDRAAVVSRFQEDPVQRLFLISLKAGGLGLNLTAAEYVFLLDPWWNPAVEAQAIDRAHRIGQERRVVAYRLVARDTVEERILELQERKKELADSIIRADAGMLRALTREDLEMLLA